MPIRSTRLVLTALVCAVLSVAGASAQTLPSSEQVLTKLRQVNDQFLRTWPDPAPDIVTDRARPSNIWTRATYFEGLMALHKIAPEARYTAYAVRWAESHDWNLAYGSTNDRVADDQCCGQTYLDLYALDPRPERLAKIKTAIDNMVNSTKRDDWWWIDALQMAMPLFARLGVITGDPRYFTAMHELYSHTRSVQGGNGLYNPVEHLWWRDADFDPPYTEPNGANCYWARGNGWVLAALVRVLDVLPANAPQRAEYIRTFQDMATALVPLQRADGFWNVSLMDPDNYGGRELTGTAFFAYGLTWGIRHGHLPRAAYLPVVAKSWRALADLAVRPDGTLGYVQGSGKQPSDSQPVTYDSAPNFDDFGTGAFLLAGSEVYQLANTPSVDTLSLRTVIEYLQTDATIVATPTANACRVEARVRGTALAAAAASSPPHLVFPDGITTRPLLFDSSTTDLHWTYAASSTTSLTAACPVGSYIFRLNDISYPRLPIAALDCPPLQPPPRTASATGTWSAGNLLLDPASNATLVANGPPGGGLATYTIEGADLRFSVAKFNSPDGRPATLSLPPWTLAPGNTYQVRLDFDDDWLPVVRPNPSDPLYLESGIRRTTSFQIVAAAPTHTREKLINVSSRGLASADDPLIAGFVISPGGPKMVLIRAVGPSLQSLGVTGALANPFLRVFNANRTRAWQCDDWQNTPQYLALTATGATTLLASYTNVRDAALAAREAGAFPLTARSRDSALVLVLPPGNYTAQVTPSPNSAAGTALVEVYELTTTQTNPRLTNLSTRGTVSATDSLTAGFVVTGGPTRVLLRAIGPMLAAVGLPSSTVLRDPKLAVFNSAGVQLAQNDNWSDSPNATDQATFRASLGAFALSPGSKDAETMLTLSPGAYTILVTSADGTAGTALVEVYTEPPGS